MDWEIVWTAHAAGQFEDAMRTAVGYSQTAADELQAAVLASVGMLAKFPEIGPAYGRDRSGQTREILCKPYRVFYRLDEIGRRVVIVTVWHSSRREPRLPK